MYDMLGALLHGGGENSFRGGQSGHSDMDGDLNPSPRQWTASGMNRARFICRTEKLEDRGVWGRAEQAGRNQHNSQRFAGAADSAEEPFLH